MVGVVMWVVRIAGRRPAIRTTHITTPTRSLKKNLHFSLISFNSN